MYPCSCKKNVTKPQSSVRCALCNMYFHIECVNVSADQHKLLCKNKNVFSFICQQCSGPEKPVKAVQSQNEINKSLHNLTVDLEKQFDEHSRTFEQQVNASFAALKSKMLELFDKFCAEQKEALEKIKSDVAHNYNILRKADTEACKRILSLEKQNNVQQRRLNRSNIVIKGLPVGIKKLREMFMKIASLCKVTLCESDVQHITYFSSGKAVLVKLNSVQTRDQIMSNFSKLKFLLLKSIDGGNSDTKVFLNDHFTQVAANLIAICRKLRDAGKILKYNLINTDVPKVKILFPNNNQEVLDTQRCLDLLDGTLIGQGFNSSLPNVL